MEFECAGDDEEVDEEELFVVVAEVVMKDIAELGCEEDGVDCEAAIIGLLLLLLVVVLS